VGLSKPGGGDGGKRGAQAGMSGGGVFPGGFMCGNGGAVIRLILRRGKAIGGGFVRMEAGNPGAFLRRFGALPSLARFHFGGFGGAEGGGFRFRADGAGKVVRRHCHVAAHGGVGGVSGGGKAGGGARFGGGVTSGAGGFMILPGFAARFGGTGGLASSSPLRRLPDLPELPAS
jgi:hypothetical protein